MLDDKDKDLLEMAKVFRMPKDNVFKYIYWPKLKRPAACMIIIVIIVTAISKFLFF
jgi:ABC-type sugar transport system permease subunit